VSCARGTTNFTLPNARIELNEALRTDLALPSATTTERVTVTASVTSIAACTSDKTPARATGKAVSEGGAIGIGIGIGLPLLLALVTTIILLIRQRKKIAPLACCHEQTSFLVPQEKDGRRVLAPAELDSQSTERMGVGR